MQPLRQLLGALKQLATPQACLFTPSDLRAVLPQLSDAAFNTLLSRAVSSGHLQRVCRGLYRYDTYPSNLPFSLSQAATKLRPMDLNYLSLETVLSDAGVISQIPMNRIMVMSSGRSNVIDCNNWGSIDFVHTRQTPDSLIKQLHYDTQNKIWRASVKQALRDMKATHRSTDLIDWNVAHELMQQNV